MRSRLAVVALAVSGCLPIPHMDQHAPAIDGLLMSGQEPLAGAVVQRAVNPSDPHAACASAPEQTRTDSQGRFHFDRQASFSFFVVMGDRQDRWHLCVVAPDGTVFSWSDWGMWGGPEHIRVRCTTSESQLQCMPDR